MTKRIEIRRAFVVVDSQAQPQRTQPIRIDRRDKRYRVMETMINAAQHNMLKMKPKQANVCTAMNQAEKDTNASGRRIETSRTYAALEFHRHAGRCIHGRTTTSSRRKLFPSNFSDFENRRYKLAKGPNCGRSCH